MPVKKYGVLKGRVTDRVIEFEKDSPHYQIRLFANNTDYRIAINVKSTVRSAPELLFLVDEDFKHIVTENLPELPEGFKLLPSQPEGMALDFIRSNLFDRLKMKKIPHDLPGKDNDLNEKLDDFVQRAMNNQEAMIYAFGSRWGPEEARDKVFKFLPGNSIHDIHMNQGNPQGPHFKDNDVYQDGALLIHFTRLDRWIAIFLAFQSQAWHTNDETGNPQESLPDSGPAHTPSPSEPDNRVRIVGAMVNPVSADPGLETVTLLNTTSEPINLRGWKIADRLKNKQELAGVLDPGATLMITLSPEVQLSNKGGIITLLNNQGLKVDGISYTKEQAKKEGETIVF